MRVDLEELWQAIRCRFRYDRSPGYRVKWWLYRLMYWLTLANTANLRNRCELVSVQSERLLNAEEAFEERHYPVVSWVRIWGFSAKTVREWLFVG